MDLWARVVDEIIPLMFESRTREHWYRKAPCILSTEGREFTVRSPAVWLSIENTLDCPSSVEV